MLFQEEVCPVEVFWEEDERVLPENTCDPEFDILSPLKSGLWFPHISVRISSPAAILDLSSSRGIPSLSAILWSCVSLIWEGSKFPRETLPPHQKGAVFGVWKNCPYPKTMSHPSMAPITPEIILSFIEK